MCPAWGDPAQHPAAPSRTYQFSNGSLSPLVQLLQFLGHVSLQIPGEEEEERVRTNPKPRADVKAGATLRFS